MKLSYGPETPYLKYYPKKMKALPQKDTCTIMFIAELQQARYRNDVFIDIQMDKENKSIHTRNVYIHALDYYSVTKNNEICMFAIHVAYILRALC